ncbi:hypothetical protein ACFOHS_10195 [Jhaorihella thermophila]
MAISYMDRTDLAHVPPREALDDEDADKIIEKADILWTRALEVSQEAGFSQSRQDQPSSRG